MAPCAATGTTGYLTPAPVYAVTSAGACSPTSGASGMLVKSAWPLKWPASHAAGTALRAA
eukprot:5066609-Alexandrium_andersonii.AAC.1